MQKWEKQCHILVDVTAVNFILSSTARFIPKSYAIVESVDIFQVERQIRR
jgi:hypothetical protein